MSKFVPQIPLVDGKNLLHATTCHVAADIYETLNTGSWNTLDRLKSESKLAHVLLTKHSIQFHDAFPIDRHLIHTAKVQVIELHNIHRIDLPVRSHTDPASGNQVYQCFHPLWVKLEFGT